MTPAPISVERLPAKWRGEKDGSLTPWASNYNGALEACAKDLERALPALLHQLAELERDNATMRDADYHQVGVEQEQEIIDLEAKLAEKDAEVERLRGLLGRCYVLAGADTDGNPPEKCADWAVRAVNDLRHDYDDACTEADELRNTAILIGRTNLDARVELTARAEAAERAREEATGLLRKIDGLIPGEILGTQLCEELDAFLAASGGDHG